MGWRTDHNYQLAREAEWKAYVASLTWREWLSMHARHKGPFLAGAAIGSLFFWMILG